MVSKSLDLVAHRKKQTEIRKLIDQESEAVQVEEPDQDEIVLYPIEVNEMCDAA